MIKQAPVILGGKPIPGSNLPFVRPVLPAPDQLERPYRSILTSGMVTTGPNAEILGERVAGMLGVNHAIAVSSCTTGLVLAIQALGLPKDSEVILPSFTFMASAAGPLWNGLKPRFADVDLNTFNLDPDSVESCVNENTSAILSVHLFGNPAPVAELKTIADKHNLALLFDAAHGFGALRDGKPVGGYGRFESFSMSPTKLLIAGEGGIVATNDAAIAEHVRLGRNYGNPGNYDCLFNGINARMSEFHAICALHSLEQLEAAAQCRNKIVSHYQSRLREIPGISFQAISRNDRCSYKDFTIVINDEEFGVAQPLLKKTLLAEGIQTRVYFSPVLHKMTAYRQFSEAGIDRRLPNTNHLESHVLSLPLYSNMTETEADIACDAMSRIHHHARELAKLPMG